MSSRTGEGGCRFSPKRTLQAPPRCLSSDPWLGCDTARGPPQTSASRLGSGMPALPCPLCLWCPLLLPGPRGSQTPERKQSVRPKQNRFLQTPAEPSLLSKPGLQQHLAGPRQGGWPQKHTPPEEGVSRFVLPKNSVFRSRDRKTQAENTVDVISGAAEARPCCALAAGSHLAPGPAVASLPLHLEWRLSCQRGWARVASFSSPATG